MPGCRRSSASGSVTSRRRSTATGATAASTTTGSTCRGCRSPGPPAIRAGAACGSLAESRLSRIRPGAGGRAFRQFRRPARHFRCPVRRWHRRPRAVGSAQRPRARARHDAHVVRCQQLRRCAAPALRVGRRLSGLSALTAAQSKIRSSPTPARIDPVGRADLGRRRAQPRLLRRQDRRRRFQRLRARRGRGARRRARGRQHRVARRRRLPASAPHQATAGSRASAAPSSCRASPPTARTSRSATAAISARNVSCRSGPIFELSGPARRAQLPPRRRRRLAGTCARNRASSSRRTPRCRPRAAIRVTRAIHATASDSGSPPRWSGASRIAQSQASGWRACAARTPTKCACRSTRAAGTTAISEPVQQPPVLLRSGGFYVLN